MLLVRNHVPDCMAVYRIQCQCTDKDLSLQVVRHGSTPWLSTVYVTQSPVSLMAALRRLRLMGDAAVTEQ